MADIYRPSLRLRPSEQLSILLLGDLIASGSAMAASIFVWYQFSIYRLMEGGLTRGRAERLISIEVPFWFYLLPLIWLLLMVESYEPHTAASWRKTLRGIAVAPIVGILDIRCSLPSTWTRARSPVLQWGPSLSLPLF